MTKQQQQTYPTAERDASHHSEEAISAILKGIRSLSRDGQKKAAELLFNQSFPNTVPEQQRRKKR